MSARRDMLAAGISDPALQQGYHQARVLNARYGRTYYLATLLLPRANRPAVHALYGFARYADNIVDGLEPAVADAERAELFDAWSAGVVADLTRGHSSDPLCLALLDTIARWDIPQQHFFDFLESMRTDLTVTEYQTYDDLARYMWGSAAVIGLQMLPILQRRAGRSDELEPYAINLGLAFQLTNFLRDIAEDLDRGRIYLPQESLARFRTDSARLRRARLTGEPDERVRAVIAFEIARARELYRRAEPGIALVHPTAQACLRTAWRLYSAILDEIERADYNVFRSRLSTSAALRARVAIPGLVQAWTARAGSG
jgi:phytoene synthase